MKFTLFFLIGFIFVAQTVVARNWPLRPIEPRNPNVIEDAIDWIKNSGTTTSKKLSEVVQKVAAEVKNFLEQAKNDGFHALGEFVKLIQKMKKLAIAGEFDKISDEIHKILDEIENGVNNILDDVTIKFDEALDIANHTLFNATRQMQNWRSNIELQLTNLPDDKKQEGSIMINEFFENSLNSCYSCSQGAIKPIKELYNKVRKLVDDTIPLVRGTVDKIEDCIKDQRVGVVKIFNCVKAVKDFVVTEVTGIPQRIFGLKRAVIIMGIKELINVPCIAATRIKIEIGKKSVQNKITQLVGDQQLLRIMY